MKCLAYGYDKILNSFERQSMCIPDAKRVLISCFMVDMPARRSVRPVKSNIYIYMIYDFLKMSAKNRNDIVQQLFCA